jgi:hypothetical protein
VGEHFAEEKLDGFAAELVILPWIGRCARRVRGNQPSGVQLVPSAFAGAARARQML